MDSIKGLIKRSIIAIKNHTFKNTSGTSEVGWLDEK